MKILFIHQFFTTNTEPGEVRHMKTIKHIASSDCVFYIIGGALNYLTGKLYDGFRGFLQKIDLGIKGTEFYRVWVAQTYRKGSLGKIVCYLTFLINACMTSFKVKKVDLVLTTSPSLFTALAGFIISRFKKVPFVLEIRDLWPKVAVEMGILRNKFIINISYKLEKFLCQKAKKIIVITKGYADYIASLGIEESKIFIIPNGVDQDYFEYKIHNFPARMKDKKEHFKIVYAGAVSQFNYIEKLVKVAEILKDESNFVFYIIGDGNRYKTLEKFVKEKKLENAIFLGLMPKEEIVNYLAHADVTIVFYPFIDTGKLLLQNKVLDYLSCGKPVIYVGPEGETANLIQSAKCGWILEDNPNKVASQIKWCSCNLEEIKKMGENGRDFVKKNYNREMLANQYFEVLIN